MTMIGQAFARLQSATATLAELVVITGPQIGCVLAEGDRVQTEGTTPDLPAASIFKTVQEKFGEVDACMKEIESALTGVPTTDQSLFVEIAPGELFDKLTILQIKSKRIRDLDKLRNVQAELAVLEATRRRAILDVPGLRVLLRGLKEVNEKLWDVEERLRNCEIERDFGPVFVALARSVYQTNDLRADIKRQLNNLLGARFREEKEYGVR